jgi:hypothetical protein
MKSEFGDVLSTCIDIFGIKAFRVAATPTKKGLLSRPLFDAEMIAVHRLFDQRDLLLEKRKKIIQGIYLLTRENTESYEVVVGRPNTAMAIRKRIDLVEKALRDAIK